jgi:formylglycine-generating enzyme required for sulfatase activity
MTSSSATEEPGQRLRVFLCHSSKDKALVRTLYQRLRSDGFAPWLDEENLIPGQNWRREISKAVSLCHVVIVCLSQTSVTKEGFVQKEISIALDVADQKPEGTIFVIPARLDENLEVPERLSQWHWVNLFEESGYRRLVHALNTRSKELGITPPIAKLEKAEATERQENQTRERGQLQTTPATILSMAAGTTKIHPKDGLKYVWIPPGTFRMGCSAGDEECYSDETPEHSVTITRGFWLGQTPVTQVAYQRVRGGNPSHFLGEQLPGFQGEQLPVETVTWSQAKAYCEAVGGRLPTEAEWEYAARAGSDAPRYGDLDEIAWYSKNSDSKTHTVGLKQANQWRLYDMLGNVWEWVGDWYDEKYYAKSPSVDPTGPTSGQYRVVRGGSWYVGSRNLRSSYRGRYVPGLGGDSLGFRCAREVFP